METSLKLMMKKTVSLGKSENGACCEGPCTVISARFILGIVLISLDLTEAFDQVSEEFILKMVNAFEYTEKFFKLDNHFK